METNLPKAISAITLLVALNNKRFTYYTQVAGKSKQLELKLLFMKYAVQAKTFNNYLTRWLNAYGTTYFAPEENVFSKAWYQIKATCTTDPRHFFLSESDSLEQEVIKKYHSILALSFFPTEAASDIRKQLYETELLYQNLKNLQLNGSSEMQVA
jgi:hypothetical protein